MNLERRLREHLAHGAGQLPPPPDRFADVARRGSRRRLAVRGAAALGAAALLLSVPLLLRGLDETTVDLEPADPGPAPTTEPEPSPTPDEDLSDDPPGALRPERLGSPVLAYGPYDHDQLMRVDRDGMQMLGPPTDAAFPDGSGGVVFKPGSQAQIRWTGASHPLVEVDGELILRGLLPGERVLYSVRPHEVGSDGGTEEFFTVALAAGSEPEHLLSTGAYERSVVGPAVAADRQLVHASCHLLCSLWLGLADGEGDEPLYVGGGSEAGPGAAIEGLTATPDGRVVGFVELDPTHPDSGPPELVLLDGMTFDELARVVLDDVGDQRAGVPTVSLSGDGQRVLVGLGASGWPGVPTAAYLVQGALTDEATVHPVDFAGALRWVDPVAASGLGGPVSAAEREIAERFVAFARDPGPGPFAAVPFADEVLVGLGPELLGGGLRQAEVLPDPAAWVFDPDMFRASVGPFSVLETLAEADETRVAGGPHAHCASPPMPIPDEVVGMRQLTIQPVGYRSCIEWFAVDLFLDGDDIAAVTLDFYEP